MCGTNNLIEFVWKFWGCSRTYPRQALSSRISSDTESAFHFPGCGAKFAQSASVVARIWVVSRGETPAFISINALVCVGT